MSTRSNSWQARALSGECSEHNQKGDRYGYGKLSLHGRAVPAHRVAYCEYHGVSISSINGLCVMHTCDNPRCVNPAHLILGTYRDNMQDKLRKGRANSPQGTAHGNAKLTAADVEAIRKAYIPRHPTCGGAALAREYGVDQSTVSTIVNHKHRKLK